MPPRPQLLTRDAAQRAFDSGDPGRIRFALVEGSPWLDEPWVFAQALAFLRHADPTSRSSSPATRATRPASAPRRPSTG